MDRELAGIRTLHLDPEDGGESPSFIPGQFNMLYVFGVGEAAISIAGRNLRNKSLLHTVREVGTVTEAICDLQRGATVGLRGPFGSTWPLASAAGKDVLLIAGGVGLPPLWSVLQEILAHRENFGTVALLLGARTPANILYRRRLERLRNRSDLFLGVTVDRAGPEWHGHVGVVTTLIDQAPFSATNSVAMICGPEVMMRFTVRELQRRGMCEDQIYLSMERNMKCAIALCGHCQFGPAFVCREGPVFRYDRIRDWLSIREL
ncbi:FAD/NAD(P)-binding protein [Verrucomicrobiota bacterium sgz303538]